MQKLGMFELEAITAGATDTQVTVLGAVMCAGATFWPLGTIMFGPSCAALLYHAATN
jgi:hypothetical protein